MTIMNESTPAEMIANFRELERTIRLMQETINALESRISEMKAPKPRTSVLTVLSEWQLKHVYDLHYYEGPLLSLFTHSEDGETDFYLMSWCNNTDDETIWMTFPVSADALFSYLDRKITFRELQHRPVGGVLYLVYIDDKLCPSKVEGPLLPEAINKDYFAEEGTYYDGK